MIEMSSKAQAAPPLLKSFLKEVTRTWSAVPIDKHNLDCGYYSGCENK